jgi:hypothetical protein
MAGRDGIESPGLGNSELEARVKETGITLSKVMNTMQLEYPTPINI